MTLTQQITEKLNTLPPEKQQEVLDFVEFLQSKMNGTNHRPLNHQPISALEAAGEWVGCIDGGPPDLSTNKAYMEGFGEA